MNRHCLSFVFVLTILLVVEFLGCDAPPAPGSATPSPSAPPPPPSGTTSVPASTSTEASDPINNASAALGERLVELWQAKLRPEHSGSSGVALAALARAEAVKEIAARQAIHEGFLVLSPAQEQTMASGQRLANSKSRSKLLAEALQGFGKKVASPPGLDASQVAATESNVDAELLAHYLEFGLLDLSASLNDNGTLDETSKVRFREIIRILREEDLAGIGTLKEVESLAKRNLANGGDPSQKSDAKE